MHRSSDGAHQLSGGAIELHLQGSVVGESKQHVPAPSSATLFFDKSTGRLRYIYTGFMDEHTNYMPPEILRMHLHALCDEAVRG